MSERAKRDRTQAISPELLHRYTTFRPSALSFIRSGTTAGRAAYRRCCSNRSPDAAGTHTPPCSESPPPSCNGPLVHPALLTLRATAADPTTPHRRQTESDPARPPPSACRSPRPQLQPHRGTRACAANARSAAPAPDPAPPLLPHSAPAPGETLPPHATTETQNTPSGHSVWKCTAGSRTHRNRTGSPPTATAPIAAPAPLATPDPPRAGAA